MHPRPRVRRGFTLIELLVVIGLIAILVSLILPAVQQSRGAARRAACTDKLRQLGLAMHNYESSFGLFPPGGVHTTTKSPGTIPNGHQDLDGRAPWTVLILPYLEENNRYVLFDFNLPFAVRKDKQNNVPEPNRTQQFEPNYRYQCPNDPTDANGLCSNYAACQGGGAPEEAAEQTFPIAGQLPRLFYDNGMFFHNSSIRIADVSDGTSNVILIGETKYIGTPSSFQPTNAWWPWSAAIRSDDQALHAALFNIASATDPINFPQNGEYTEEDIRQKLAVQEGMHHGGQQRVFGSWHPGGCSFVLADGSVRFLNENMDVESYRRMGKRADGVPVSF